MKEKKFRHDLATSTLVLQVLVYIDLKYYDLAMKHINYVFEIAEANKYDPSEIAIFETIKKMVKTEEPKAYMDEIKEIIEEKTVPLINLDKDVVMFWLEKRGS